MKIVLLGYMASGKSLIGSKLAEILNTNFVDLDAYIEKKEKLSIPNIFKTKGEIYFRNIENKYLLEILKSKNGFILSLGGGTPCYSNNMEMLLNTKHVKIIYLNVSVKVLVKRLLTEKENRPLISHLDSEKELLNFVGIHLFERAKFYNQSHVILDANGRVEDVLEKCVLQLF